jgi:hypothetical protein
VLQSCSPIAIKRMRPILLETPIDCISIGGDQQPANYALPTTLAVPMRSMSPSAP